MQSNCDNILIPWTVTVDVYVRMNPIHINQSCSKPVLGFFQARCIELTLDVFLGAHITMGFVIYLAYVNKA